MCACECLCVNKSERRRVFFIYTTVWNAEVTSFLLAVLLTGWQVKNSRRMRVCKKTKHSENLRKTTTVTDKWFRSLLENTSTSVCEWVSVCCTRLWWGSRNAERTLHLGCFRRINSADVWLDGDGEGRACNGNMSAQISFIHKTSDTDGKHQRNSADIKGLHLNAD